MPIVLWGSHCWRILTAVVSMLILAYGIYSVGTDIMMGHVLWWYNLSFVLFALAGFTLLLLVREGLKTFDNVVKYGLHPKTRAEFEREAGVEEEPKSRSSLQELVDRPASTQADSDQEEK